MQGNIYIIAAASGTGKTSLVKVLVESLDNVAISISHTTRQIRVGEQNGEHYFFISNEEFEKKIKAHKFLEYAKVFDCYYGTPRDWVEKQLNKGIDVILEIDWQGAEQVKKLIPQCISIFILPPSLKELQRRLEGRNQDSKTTIAKRLANSHKEILHCRDFDYIVVNDKFEVALVDIRSIIRSHRLLKDVQLVRQKKLLTELTS
jgi:guanylate kinase